MDLKGYSKMSKETGKTVLIIVRGDLAAHAEVETKDIQKESLGDHIIQALDEAIKDKEEGK